MKKDPYTDVHGVLINKLGITSASDLRRVESDLSFGALLRLAESRVPGTYDLEHLCEFHRRLFDAIYPWAGQVRTVSIARSEQDVFCLPEHIESYASGVFRQLAAECHLVGLDRGAFVVRLAHYYAEVNAIHPFREGNGRAQRSFFRQLGLEAGWAIRWSLLDPVVNDRASAAGLHGDEQPLRRMFEGLVMRVSPVDRSPFPMPPVAGDPSVNIAHELEAAREDERY